MELQKLTDQEFFDRIEGSWQDTEHIEHFAPQQYFANVIGGTIVHADTVDLETHHVYNCIIRNPTYEIGDQQLCMIIDMGNHCVSDGSITYEENYAYIVWSNLGHI